ncbi:MAG: hypothetical protein RLT05_11915, partial [Bauldia litoralis]
MPTTATAAADLLDANLPNADACAAACHEALGRAERRHAPFNHWLLVRVLPPATAEALLALPFEPGPAMRFDQGRREDNNADRVYFDAAVQAWHPVCAAVAWAFQAPGTAAAIEALCGVDLRGTSLRI